MFVESKRLERPARWQDGAAARVVLPSLLLLALGVIAIFWVSRTIADDLDKQALEREERVISTLIKTKSHHWGKLALDYAFWDDAYTHLARTPEPEWMDGNFDQDVAESQGATAFILMTDKLAVEAWYGELRDDAAVESAAGLRDLVAAVMAKRGIGPHFVDGLIKWRGEIALAGVARLMPQNSQIDPNLTPKLTVFVYVLTPKAVSEWSQNLEIADMSLVASADPSGPHLALKTRRGETLGLIQWTSDAPGTKFMQSQVMVRTLIMLGLMVAFAALVFAWASTMRRLSASAAKAEALAESSRSKSAFLANMSHELRTPLNAIIGFSEMMKEEVFGPLGRPQYKEYVGHVHGSGKHLLQIINSLLDVAKFQAGQFDQKPEPMTLCEIARAAISAHRDSFADAGVTIEAHGEGQQVVLADARSMARIFDAVLSNAAKFTPRGGKVDIVLIDGPRPSIAIRDTGCGIPRDKLEAMGLPFEQAADVMKRNHGGVGLGLAFSRMLMEGQNGGLRLESALGQGTTVTLVLPPAPSAVAMAA
jgi:signal transduction histidine kinase